MSDQLFIYYIENPLMIISVNSGSWGGVMVIRLLGGIGKGGTKKDGWVKGAWVGEEVWGLLGFVALMCVCMYFSCCCGGCLCQGLHGAGVVYSWYSRIVSGC
jgi:hypothetical protein